MAPVAAVSGVLPAPIGEARVSVVDVRDLVDITPDAFAERVRAFLPPWQVDGLVEDYAHDARGEAAAVSGAVEAVTRARAADARRVRRRPRLRVPAGRGVTRATGPSDRTGWQPARGGRDVLSAVSGGVYGPVVRRPEKECRVNEHDSEEPVVEETLVEEVSIDGMCGVY